METMRVPSASELLSVWERCAEETPERRALALLSMACSDGPGDVARMSIGERDACLLTLREWMFGSAFECLALCPSCSVELELNFQVDDIRVPPAAQTDSTLAVEGPGYCVSFRLPNGSDLADAADLAPGHDVASLRRKLLERCVIEARYGERAVSSLELPEDLTMRISERMAQADPQANVDLALECAQCRHAWHSRFDIGTVLWSEIHAWAVRLLRDVHDLAWAYGWREADILGLSPRRRGFYLELIRA
jgi:hypothetical protein